MPIGIYKQMEVVMKNCFTQNIRGAEVLFSYGTPVALLDTDGVYVVTEEKFSSTTSKHISQFVPKRAEQISVPQEMLEEKCGNFRTVYRQTVDRFKTFY